MMLSNLGNNNANQRPPLLAAVREGNIDTARQLLTDGADVDGRGEAMQLTPLMAAAGRGDASMVRLLLEAGADPNAVGKNGAGALARAVVSGDVETVKTILEAGANPRGSDALAPPSTSPLWAAVATKRQEMVELLLQHGAEPNTGNAVTDTLFGFAVSGGDAEIARLLLDAGADPTRPGLSNVPLQAVSLRFTNPPMAQLLKERGFSLAKDDTESGW